jgi:hypothetical protein
MEFASSEKSKLQGVLVGLEAEHSEYSVCEP